MIESPIFLVLKLVMYGPPRLWNHQQSTTQSDKVTTGQKTTRNTSEICLDYSKAASSSKHPLLVFVIVCATAHAFRVKCSAIMMSQHSTQYVSFLHKKSKRNVNSLRFIHDLNINLATQFLKVSLHHHRLRLNLSIWLQLVSMSQYFSPHRLLLVNLTSNTTETACPPEMNSQACNVTYPSGIIIMDNQLFVSSQVSADNHAVVSVQSKCTDLISMLSCAAVGDSVIETALFSPALISLHFTCDLPAAYYSHNYLSCWAYCDVDSEWLHCSTNSFSDSLSLVFNSTLRSTAGHKVCKGRDVKLVYPISLTFVSQRCSLTWSLASVGRCVVCYWLVDFYIHVGDTSPS